MVNKKKSIAAKAGLILLVVMLFFTFFSKTINSFLTPKVTIAPARYGTLMLEDGDQNGILIPQSALIDWSGVYVVTQTDAFLGTQLRTEFRFVVIGEGNGVQVLIPSGLSENEYIVTSWDRPLTDGCRVLLPND